jgi:MoaA/NifB/PqqE/SkfB family radical SAM enzyme
MSARNFFNLLAGKAAGHIDRVPILILNSHSRCNCRCVMCDIWKVAEARSLSQADLRPHLHSIAALGVRQVVFSGGEPLMNPGLWLLCRMLRAGGIRLTLLSTGLLFEKYAAEIVAELDEAIVSLDGPPEVHDTIRGVKGAFERLQKGIDSVRRQRAAFPISARTTVQSLNFRHLLSTVAVARQL